MLFSDAEKVVERWFESCAVGESFLTGQMKGVGIGLDREWDAARGKWP